MAVSVHLIKIPMTAKVFPIVIVMGMMILIAALVVGIVDAAITIALSRSPSQSAAGPSCGRKFLGDKGQWLLDESGVIMEIGGPSQETVFESDTSENV